MAILKGAGEGTFLTRYVNQLQDGIQKQTFTETPVSALTP